MALFVSFFFLAHFDNKSATTTVLDVQIWQKKPKKKTMFPGVTRPASLFEKYMFFMWRAKYEYCLQLDIKTTWTLEMHLWNCTMLRTIQTCAKVIKLRRFIQNLIWTQRYYSCFSSYGFLSVSRFKLFTVSLCRPSEAVRQIRVHRHASMCSSATQPLAGIKGSIFQRRTPSS